MKSLMYNFRVFGLASAILFASCKGNSQQNNAISANIDKTQVTWNTSIDDALAQAKAQNKMLFVECYSPTCPVCISMEPFFKKTEIAQKYNSDFINYKLDVGNAEQVKFLNSKNIWLPSFPQFLYFDSDGNLVHQADVVTEVKSFIEAANMAQNIEKRAGNYKKRFDSGERNMDLLVNYSAFCRLTKDTLNNLIAANELFKIYPKDQLGSEMSWKLTKKCIADIENGFSTYWFDHVAQAAAFEKKDGHEGVENNILGGIIQSSLYSPRGRKYGSDKIALVKKYMAKTGAGQYIDGVTWEFETMALIREGKAPQTLAIGDKMVAKYAQNGQSLVYVTKVFNDYYPDKGYVAKAKTWLAKAKPSIKENKYLAEYFFESARLNQKAGNLVAAKADAQQARNLASLAQVDLAKFTDLLNKL